MHIHQETLPCSRIDDYNGTFAAFADELLRMISSSFSSSSGNRFAKGYSVAVNILKGLLIPAEGGGTSAYQPPLCAPLLLNVSSKTSSWILAPLRLDSK